MNSDDEIKNEINKEYGHFFINQKSKHEQTESEMHANNLDEEME